MRRYESYKDSGVEWMGEVPSHWEISSLGKIFLSVSEKNRPDLPLLSITRELGVIERDTEDQDSNHNFIPDDLSNYKILKKGQFGMNKMKAWQGSYGVSNFTGIVSPAYYIFDFIKSINPQFFHWAIRSKIYVSFFGSASDGVRIGQWDLSKSRMKSIPFIIPSNNEQQKIAQFLDDKTAKIDQAVNLAEKQIALLKEHKQILIQNAVTRGLNPDVPLKDSGVEWIGQVPEHWEILSIKRLSQVKRGASPRPIDNPKYFDNDGEYAWVRISDVTASNMYLLETTQKLSNLGKSYSVPLMPGSLFLSIAGSVGKPIITKIKVCIHDGFVYFPEYKQNTKFLYYIFYSEQPYIGLGKMGTQLNLNTDTVGAIKIPIPPLCEQQKIADYLDTQTAKIDQAIALKTAHIEKLKEYKSVLINDVVTGKVQV